MKNAISIDLEDWFCVYNLSGAIPRDQWDQCQSRVVETTNRLLALLDKHHTLATFFVLGYIARRRPDLVRDIETRGHEIAVHGYNHKLLTQITPKEFEQDLTDALDALRHCGVQQEILGYRAPSFTVTETTRWAFEILKRHGLRYDSSVFPVGFHPDYGMPDSPLGPHQVADGLWEFPLSVAEWLGRRLPCSGGGYFRLFPYFYTRFCIRRCNRQGRPVVFYLHPWELDPGQPRVELPWTKSFRHYHNLHKTEKRLDRLLGDFEFTTIREVLAL